MRDHSARFSETTSPEKDTYSWHKVLHFIVSESVTKDNMFVHTVS